MSAQPNIKDPLSDEWWRLNNLYKIVNEQGRQVTFKLNWAQTKLYEEMWYLDIILKARQLGMTTFIQLFMLDRCLFGKDVSAGVIAHNREDAQDFFSKKIKYAYDNLPDWLRDKIPTVGDSANQLAFNNGSSIRVGTSLRSGTYQYLHVSEFGKICAKYADKASEIISGSLNTVHAGQYVFIESTAEGAYGSFYDMVQDSRKASDLTQLDYKFFFYPWYQHPGYTIDPVSISEEEDSYFNSLDVDLTEGQKSWYVRKKRIQKGLMKQEFPSSPDEAFQRISEHAVYGAEMRKVREEGRIGLFPHDPSLPVYTFWDLGRSKTDQMSIWFMQDMGGRYRFINFESGVKKPVDYYVRILHDKPYVYNTHYLPHDGGHDDFTLQTFQDHLKKLGIRNVEVVPRIPHINEGIQLTRDRLALCEFDEDACAEGLLGLEAYRYEYDEGLGAYKNVVHDWSSHPADAFRQFAQGYKRRSARQQLPMSKRRQDKIRTHSRPEVSWMV